MTIIVVFKAALHVLLSLLMFLVPLYVNRLEKSWKDRLFAPHSLETTAQTLSKYLTGIHEEVRRSVARVSLTISGLLAILLALFPTIIMECLCVLALITYALYRKYDNTRRCPSCYSFILDSTKTCPDCCQEIGSNWGIVGREINANWLTVNSRFFRYKCS